MPKAKKALSIEKRIQKAKEQESQKIYTGKKGRPRKTGFKYWESPKGSK